MYNNANTEILYSLIDPLVDANSESLLAEVEALLAEEDGQLPKEILDELISLSSGNSISVEDLFALRSLVFLCSYPLIDQKRMVKLGLSLIASFEDPNEVLIRLAAIGELERRSLPENVQSLLRDIDLIVEDAREGFGDICVPPCFDVNIIRTF